MKFTKHDLQQLDTVEQAWDGDELKIDQENIRIWLTHRENTAYNGDYVVETRVNGSWYQKSCYFN